MKPAERTSLAFLLEACRPRQRTLLALTAFSALLVALERAIPALAGVALGARGVTWAAGIGLAGSAVMALRSVLRQRSAHAMRTTFLDTVAHALARRSSLGATSGRADRLEATLFGSSYASTKLVADDAPSLAGNLLALVLLVPVLVAIGSGKLVVVGVPVLLAVAGAVLLLRRAIGRSSKGAIDRSRELVDAVAMLLRGHFDLVSSARAEGQAALIARRGDAYSEALLRAERTSALAGRLPMAVAAGVAVVVAWLWLRDEPALLTAGLAKALVIGSALPIIAGLGRAATEVPRDLRELWPLVEVLDSPPDPRSRPGAVALDPWDAIRFHHVSYGYDAVSSSDAPPVLCDVSVLWKRGECLALTGPNGCGKSTMLRLLLRLADPNEGALYVGATDLREGDVDAWRRSIAFLPQRPYLPESVSLREALVALGPDVPEPALLEALRQVGLLARLERWNAADPLAAGVAQLSAGERQRFALARMLASTAPILILDEPDANLDAAGLAALIALVPELARDRRVLLVAHHPDLIASADRVFELPHPSVADALPLRQASR